MTAAPAAAVETVTLDVVLELELARLRLLLDGRHAPELDSADERRTVRQQKTKPLAEALRAWLEKTLAQVASGSSIAQAIRYALNRWDGLVRFLDDGRIEIDSNTVERAIRPIALSRKNALFAGSDEGAENWAMLASLIESCKLHGVNPEAYLTDVLTKLVNNWPNSRIAELTPWGWSTAQ